ncbi:MAG: NADH-quinone oxidoreductase subunit J [Betaproteobacteria bacterium]
MDVKAGLFYVFAALLLFAAFRVVTARNPVHAALYLVWSFVQAAMIWVLLHAEFLAMALVLVYVGAVMVLFLFVVMMLDINFDSIRLGFWRHLPLAGLIGVVIALEMAGVLMGIRQSEPKAMAVVQSLSGQVSNTRDLGILLYSEYVFPVQIAAVILLVAIIAAIALTLRERKDSKHIPVGVQVRVHAKDRLRVVQMSATQASQPIADVPAADTPAAEGNKA